MFFHVKDLEVRAGQFDVELPPGAIEYPDLKIRQTGPLKASGQVELAIAALGEIRVKGHISVQWRPIATAAWSRRNVPWMRISSYVWLMGVRWPKGTGKKSRSTRVRLRWDFTRAAEWN